ncbi:flagellar hook-length control protein FliK, partial [Caenispirillum bisanense]|uniref:flagellar hook-length control protein FliK n=1 Tax=Caenispirillum bisanense TaxID=414052 RepID=UPI0031D32BE6
REAAAAQASTPLPGAAEDGEFGGLLGRTAAASAAGRTAAAGRPAATAHARLHDLPDQLRHRLTDAAFSRKGTITLQVRPERLGQVDVKLQFGQDNHVRVQVVADSREAIDVLRADARSLERALNDAGLKTDDTSLSFELRGGDRDAQQQQDRQQQTGTAGRPSSSDDGAAATPEPLDVQARAAALAAARGGVDIRA